MDKMREFEHNRALMEAHRNTAVDEYFKARPQLMRTRHEECLVEAGFTKAWDVLQAAQSAAVPVVGEVVAWISPLDLERIQANDRLNIRLTAGKESILISDVPLYLKPTTSITAAELDALRKKAARWEHFKRTATWIDSRDDGIKWVIYYDMPRPEIFGPTAGMDEAADKAIAGEKK